MSTQAQHTQGEWKARPAVEVAAYESPCFVIHRGDDPIAVVLGDNDEDLANAKLIVAAPDLLAAVEEMLAVFAPGVDSFGAGAGELEAVAISRAAVAKARGQQ